MSDSNPNQPPDPSKPAWDPNSSPGIPIGRTIRPGPTTRLRPRAVRSAYEQTQPADQNPGYGQSAPYGQTQSYGSAASYGSASSYGSAPEAQGGYQQPAYPPAPQSGYVVAQPYGALPEHPQGTTILVLGIVGLFVTICAPIAWYMGSKAQKEIAASGQHYSNEQNIAIGKIIGMVLSILAIVGIVIAIIFIMIAIVAGVATAVAERGELDMTSVVDG